MDIAVSLGLGRGPRLRPLEVAAVLFAGLLAGLLLGYTIMGTAHAVFDIGAEEHYRRDA